MRTLRELHQELEYLFVHHRPIDPEAVQRMQAVHDDLGRYIAAESSANVATATNPIYRPDQLSPQAVKNRLGGILQLYNTDPTAAARATLELHDGIPDLPDPPVSPEVLPGRPIEVEPSPPPAAVFE